MSERELTLERKDQPDGTLRAAGLMMTPDLGEDYWAYRVVLSERQAVVGFPKFGTIGIGYAVEDVDWNSNLPYTSDAREIAEHIRLNKGDLSIENADVITAIRLIQEAVKADREETS